MGASVASAESLALQLADAARDTWRAVRGRDDLHHEVGQGADGTPTLRIDEILDNAILERAADLGIGVVSEESGKTEAGNNSLWAYVDPLDGSRNAARGIPFFCTSIAISDRAGPEGLLAGVVRNLVTNETIHAGDGPLRVDGDPHTPRPYNPDEVMVAVIADSATDEIKAEQGRRGHHMRDLGSAALEMAYIATGALDAFVVRQPWLRNIDIAAGMHLIDRAGGEHHDPQGGPVKLGYDVRERVGIIAGRGGALEAIA